MKSNQLFQSLAILCLVLILTNINSTRNSLRAETGLNKESLKGSSVTPNELVSLWADLFTENRGQSCKAAEMRNKIITALAAEGRLPGQIIGRKVKNSKFAWIKRWGYGESAYLFDFFDPVFQKDMILAFKKLYNDVMAVSNKDTDEYKDPLDIKKLLDPNTKANAPLNLNALNKNYNPVIYDISANSVQLREIMKNWNWFMEIGEANYAINFILKYDINGDGRLNARELVLGAIEHNKNTIGSGICQNCFQELAKKIDAIFIFLDCDNDGFLSAEDLWNSLPKVNRSDTKWNIFGMTNSDNIRTNAINDFVIKNGVANGGSVSKEQFRNGILLGYWDRQTGETGVVEDDSRNLKNFRWSEGGMTDTVAFNYLKEKTLAELIAKSNHQ